jgi:hypothetical protein
MNDDAISIIHGIKPSRLTAHERTVALIRRPWSRNERAVVLAGFFGRAAIAIEPVLCGIVFAGITLGVFFAPRFSHAVNSDIIIIAPVFGIGVLACIAWAIGVMHAPVQALLHTLRPIYIVDGYIRFRPRDTSSPERGNGYIAVLTADGVIACEWATYGDEELPRHSRPAHVEFSEYGGVHAVDGRRTGVLPERIPALGVGIAPRRGGIR